MASAKHSDSNKRNSPPRYHLSIMNKAGKVFHSKLNFLCIKELKSGFRAVPLCLYFDTWRPSALSKQSVGGPGQVVSACRRILRLDVPLLCEVASKSRPLFDTSDAECSCVSGLTKFHIPEEKPRRVSMRLL